jgi:hypothetical protein
MQKEVRLLFRNVNEIVQFLSLGDFEHRRYGDGATDSICLRCFMTVASTLRNAEKELAESKAALQTARSSALHDPLTKWRIKSCVPITIAKTLIGCIETKSHAH